MLLLCLDNDRRNFLSQFQDCLEFPLENLGVAQHVQSLLLAYDFYVFLDHCIICVTYCLSNHKDNAIRHHLYSCFLQIERIE